MSGEQIVLQLNNLSKHFTMHIRDGKQIEGCQNINFAVAEGEFLGIVGPSGTGKSTILKCIYRTYLVSSGSILYRTLKGNILDLAAASDEEILRLRREEISYVSQFLKVIPRIPAIDVVAESLLLKGVPVHEARERAAGILQKFGIDRNLWDAYPSTFSGGEQQRINLARALISEPRLLLLDEPTASLDQNTKQSIIRVLKELKGKGTTFVGIFHDLDSMQRIADRVYAVKPENKKAVDSIVQPNFKYQLIQEVVR